MCARAQRAVHGRRERTKTPSAQPGLPMGEARLLGVREEAGSVLLTLDTGHQYELAPGSLPADLPGPGEVVPVSVLAAIALAAERKLVARRLFALLDRRLQPVARLRDKLIARGHSEEAVTAVLEQMREQGLYSDRRYAEAFCRDCLLNRAVGRRYLVQKLWEKQVDKNLATAVVAEILDPDTEARLADKAARARWRRMQGPTDYKALARVVRFLTGRGFGAGLANGAARRAQPVDDLETEF